MPSAGAPPGSVAFLTNSTTKIPKATYVPVKVPDDEKSRAQIARSGGAVRKWGFVRSLALQPGEVDAVLAPPNATGGSNATSSPLYTLLKQLEGAQLPTALPPISKFSAVADADLIAFGNGLVAIRQKAAAAAHQVTARVPVHDPAAADQAASLLNLVNTALASTQTFAGSSTSATSPIGMLNLERIEMTPAGIERGGLIATIPLAPKERTIVVQQEWSVITKEFTSIVTDSLDNYSETGVTDTTQLSQSTTSQVAHNNQFNINASVSGSCGFVTASVATSFGSQDQNSQSATNSRQHAVQTTRKASSRSIQSHKTTISTTTTTGTSNTNTRMLENPSATDSMRIDYFNLMRKWHCALYRYGLRLTYDITVPEPGAAMREIYAHLDRLQKWANTQFSFSIKHSAITPSTYLALADQHSVDVPPPPSPLSSVVQVGPVTIADPSDPSTIKPATFPVPDGYWVKNIYFTAYSSKQDPPDPSHSFYVMNYNKQSLAGTDKSIDLCDGGIYLWHQSGTLAMTLVWHDHKKMDDSAAAYFFVNCVPTDNAMAQWQSTVWTALYNAAQAQFSAQQQAISDEISALQNRISNVDTLTLRREENDEIMKCALRWLLGANFEFMPQNIIALFKNTGGANIKYGIDFTGNDSGISKPNSWTIAKQHEERINFINQAIDWDNVIYFLYSYFWDVPQSWDFIRQIQHPDLTRQAFLRAGSARIVLTVRKGWELAWTYFVEYGSTSLPDQLPTPTHPYLPIAQQIQDYDDINYPGIPPANPDGGGPIDDGTPQVGTTSTATLSPSASPVTIQVADSTGFRTGAQAIIDTWDSGVQERQPITAVPDGTHITVQALTKAHSTAQNSSLPYPIVQAGESGLLIAEWFEYTPTSGTDIAVTSNLATIT